MNSLWLDLNEITPRRPETQSAFLVGGKIYTWGEFIRAVNDSSEAIVNMPEEIWLLHCEELYEFAVGFFALLGAGKSVVIPPNFLDGTILYLEKYYDEVFTEERVVIDSSKGNRKGAPGRKLTLPREGAIQIFTSGTTGKPKEVRKTFAQLVDEVEVLERLFGDKCGDSVVAGSVPHQHIYGLLFRLLWPLAAGRLIVTMQAFDPVDFSESTKRSKRSVFVSSPSFLSRLHELVDLSDFRGKIGTIFSSGGALKAEDAMAFRLVSGQAPTEIFGSTETGGVAWRQADGGENQGIWSAFPDVSLGRNEKGNLTVKSPFTGHVRMTLGDEAEILPGNRFRLGHRLDRIVKVQEKRVSLEEIEQMLKELPEVKNAAVIYRPDTSSRLLAVVVPTEKMEANDRNRRLVFINRLKDHLNGRFERSVLPRQWRFVGALPYDDRGKLSEETLLALFSKR